MSKTPEQWCEEGKALNTEGKKEEAEKCFNEAIGLDPNFGLAYHLKALVFGDINRETEAVELYKKAISLGHDFWNSYYNMGIDLNSLGRREEAIVAYTKAIEKDPTKADCYRNRGNAQMMIGRTQEAVESYAKAIELAPDLYDVYADIGPLLEDMGKRDEAMKYYETCISRNPKDFRSNYCKGLLLRREGKYQEAIECLEVSLEDKQLHPGTNYHIGSCYIALGEKDKAMSYFNKADQMEPEISIHYCNRGQCYFAIGQKENGLADFEKARELLENDKKTMLLPTYINFVKNAIKVVLETEDTAKKIEDELKNHDENHPVVQKFVRNVKRQRENHDRLQTQVILKLDKHTAEAKDHVDELEKFKEEYQKEIDQMQKEIDEMKNKINSAQKTVQKHEQKKEQERKEKNKSMEELLQEVDSKMEDFNKKLVTALDKQEGLSQEDRTKLKEYYSAFVQTFSSVYATSHIINNDRQVKLEVGNNSRSVLSFIASFASVIGDGIPANTMSVDELLHSHQMAKHANALKGIGHDTDAFSKLIGETGFTIITNSRKQQEVIRTKEEDLKQISDTLLQKVKKICEKLSDKIDVDSYAQLYKTPAEQVGHKDANELVEKWVQGNISPYGIHEEFVSIILREDKSQPEGHNSGRKGTCCNLF